MELGGLAPLEFLAKLKGELLPTESQMYYYTGTPVATVLKLRCSK